MIKVTQKARAKLQALRKEEGHARDCNVRVAVRGGGCSGLLYDLSFDAKMAHDDKAYEDQEVKIVVDKKSLLYLIGTTLDFSDGLNGKGFHFTNPNAQRTCGCGESFAV